MIVLITGAQGFVGSHLCGRMLAEGHRVIALGRSPRATLIHDNYRYLSADTTIPGEWVTALSDIDVAVNLAGESIFKRWTARAKQRISESRILTTRNLVDHLPAGKPLTLISASGVGFYGNRGDDVLTEDEPAGDDFLAGLSIDWEGEALRAVEKGARVAVMRFGIVLGPGGGALAKMVPAFKAFAGGRLGNGRQWFPWIHIDDLMAAIAFLMDSPDLSGPFNFCSPQPVRNSELTASLGSVLGRPAVLSTPAVILRMALGEAAGVLLGSQRAIPDRLTRAGFTFDYPNLRPALEAILA